MEKTNVCTNSLCTWASCDVSNTENFQILEFVLSRGARVPRDWLFCIAQNRYEVVPECHAVCKKTLSDLHIGPHHQKFLLLCCELWPGNEGSGGIQSSLVVFIKIKINIQFLQSLRSVTRNPTKISQLQRTLSTWVICPMHPWYSPMEYIPLS